MLKTLISTTLLLLISAQCGCASDVPRSYSDLYDALERKLDITSEKIAKKWDGERHAVDFSAELISANSNRGVKLLTPQTRELVELEMAMLGKIGTKAVTISIDFPVLYAPFHQFNGTDNSAFVAFYEWTVDHARKNSMKVIVELGSGIFPGIYSMGSGLDVQPFYASFQSVSHYAKARTEMAQLIIDKLRPDYLSLSEEPDTEALLTGLPLDDLETYSKIVRYQVRTLNRPSVARVQLGAGVGTWHKNAENWVHSYSHVEGLDYISLHVYPVNPLSSAEKYDLLWRLFSLSDIAIKHDKGVGVGECWLYKCRDSELGKAHGAVDPTIFARDVYDFWLPLDTKFLKVMVDGSHWKEFSFLSPFWGRIMYGGYLPYNWKTAFLRPEKLFELSNRLAYEGLKNGEPGPLGNAYSRLIKNSSYDGPGRSTGE